MELWDAYTRKGIMTDIKLMRGEPIPDGLYHIVCEVLVQHQDGDYLLMQRDWSKATYAGCYEASAGGSALAGETADVAIQRELTEETGLHGHDFRLVNYVVTEPDHCLYYSYICHVSEPKDSVRLQEGETIGYRWLNPNDFKHYVNSDQIIPSQKAKYLNYFRESRIVEDK